MGRPPLTTGHPDQDAFEAQLHAELLAERAERERALAEMAARFAVPAPVTVGDVLPLFARLGLLTVRRDGDEVRYLVPAEQPHVRDVLDLPAQRLAAIDEQQMFHRYCAPATDLVAVAMWTPAGRVGTVADLARRVLMQTSDVRAALGYARLQQLLRVDGDGASPADDDAGQLTLTVLPRSAQEPADQPRLEVPGFADVPHVIEPISPVDSDAVGKEYAQGPPPRAGIVTTSGTLVIWRDGDAEVLAGVSGDVQRAVATPHGVVVLGLSRCVLVGPDGRAEVLATNINCRGAVSADGRYLALAQARYGRRPTFSLRVIDLADRSPQILQWPENPMVAGVYGDTVYFSSDKAGGLRWTPGSDPEPLPWAPRAVDSRTGVMLVDGEAAGADGWLVIGQHGERANVLVTLTADLVPGGTHLIDFRYSPPAVTLFDVAFDGAADGADPRVWWLPEGCHMSMPCGPAWEDAGHLLLRRPYSGGAPAVRLDVRTGDIEGVPLPGIEGYEVAAFVESPG